jgi:hypothetical protein
MQESSDGAGALTVAVCLDPVGSVEIAGHLSELDGGLFHAAIAAAVVTAQLGEGDELVLEVSNLTSVSPLAESVLRGEKRYLDDRGIRLAIATSREAQRLPAAPTGPTDSGSASHALRQRDAWRSPPLRLVTGGE